MRTMVNNLKGTAEWRGKKIIRLNQATLYLTPIDSFRASKIKSYNDLCVSGRVVSGVTLPRAYKSWPKGVTKNISSFCSDKIVLESKEAKFVITNVEFDTVFENGSLKDVDFHGLIDTAIYNTSVKKVAGRTQ